MKIWRSTKTSTIWTKISWKISKRKSKISESYYTLTLHLKAGLSDEQTGLFSTAFNEDFLSYSSKKGKGAWDFLWTFEGRPDDEILRANFAAIAQALSLSESLFDGYVIEELEDRDWLAESYHALPPFTIGSFFIYGSHYTDAAPEGQIPLLIEAATAFGSGEHGTTSRCILAIEHVKNSGFKPRSILDMGCGSGILAAAAAKLWPDVPVFAADNDPECVRVSRRHLDVNDLGRVPAYQSEGFDQDSPVWNDAPYDFLIANILAAPLMEMAEDLCRAVAPGGYVILSGMLDEQSERVFAAYQPHGMVLRGKFPGDEWMTLLLQKI